MTEDIVRTLIVEELLRLPSTRKKLSRVRDYWSWAPITDELIRLPCRRKIFFASTYRQESCNTTFHEQKDLTPEKLSLVRTLCRGTYNITVREKKDIQKNYSSWAPFAEGLVTLLFTCEKIYHCNYCSWVLFTENLIRLLSRSWKISRKRNTIAHEHLSRKNAQDYSLRAEKFLARETLLSTRDPIRSKFFVRFLSTSNPFPTERFPSTSNPFRAERFSSTDHFRTYLGYLVEILPGRLKI